MNIHKIKAIGRSPNGEGGFSLVELLVVIAILAILAAVAIPLVTSRVQEAAAAADEANVRLLQGAVNLWMIDNPEDVLVTANDNTDSWQERLKTLGYLSEIVESPHKKGVPGYRVEIEEITATGDGTVQNTTIYKVGSLHGE